MSCVGVQFTFGLSLRITPNHQFSVAKRGLKLTLLINGNGEGGVVVDPFCAKFIATFCVCHINSYTDNLLAVD